MPVFIVFSLIYIKLTNSQRFKSVQCDLIHMKVFPIPINEHIHHLTCLFLFQCDQLKSLYYILDPQTYSSYNRSLYSFTNLSLFPLVFILQHLPGILFLFLLRIFLILQSPSPTFLNPLLSHHKMLQTLHNSTKSSCLYQSLELVMKCTQKYYVCISIHP